MKHTPGPWTPIFIEIDNGWQIVPPEAFKDGQRWFADSIASSVRSCDVNLIAAAPDLLSLLKELIDIEDPRPGDWAWADKVFAAIAKAEGV